MYYLSKISHNPFPNIKCNNTSTKEIEGIIHSITVKNSHGYDGITIKMLKVSAPYISFLLNYICNKSIRSGTFPTHLKYSIVKLLFKGDRENTAKYRPISLLTSFSKVFEKTIHEILLQHNKVNKILVEEQFGFRPATSTDKASYRLINERKVVGSIFCNLQMAFHCVINFILLTKLEFYGVTGTILKLIKSYLEGINCIIRELLFYVVRRMYDVSLSFIL
jgi:hypothetical protein